MQILLTVYELRDMGNVCSCCVNILYTTTDAGCRSAHRCVRGHTSAPANKTIIMCMISFYQEQGRWHRFVLPPQLCVLNLKVKESLLNNFLSLETFRDRSSKLHEIFSTTLCFRQVYFLFFNRYKRESRA
jgi:hypothetical protein